MISLSSHHVRAQQRDALDLRKVSTKFNLVATQDSSAQFQFGNLSVLATVSGPTEVRIRDELTDRATLQVGFTPLNGVPGIATTSFSHSLRSLFTPLLLLHHHPRTLLSFHVQVLSSSSAPITSSYHSSLSSVAPVSRPRKGGRAAPTAISSDEARSAPLPLASTRARAPHPDAPPTPAEKAAAINALQLALLAGGPVIGARATVASCSCVVVLARDAKRLRPSSARRTGMRAGEEEEQESAGEDDDDEMLDASVPQSRSQRPKTTILLDPTPAEEVVALSVHVLAFAFFGRKVRSMSVAEGEGAEKEEMDEDEQDDVDDQLVYADSTGRIGLEKYDEVLALSRSGALAVYHHMRRAVASNIRQSYRALPP